MEDRNDGAKRPFGDLRAQKKWKGKSKMQTVANYNAQNLSTRNIMAEYYRNTYFTWLAGHNLSFNFAWVKFAQLKINATGITDASAKQPVRTDAVAVAAHFQFVRKNVPDRD